MPGLLSFLGGNQAQMPGSARPNPMQGLLDPQVALPMAAALMGNQGNTANFGNAFAAAAPAFQQRAESQAQARQKSQTLELLRREAPDIAQAVETGGYDPNKALDLYFKRREAQGPKPTDDIREYEFAKSQGYQGSFQDYMTDQRKAGATNVTVGGGKYGTIPQGYELVEGPEGAQMRPIPGGPAAMEAEAAAREAETRQGVQASTDLGKSDTMLDATSSVKELMKEANTPTTGTLSRPFALYSGSAAGKIRSYVGALQSGVALNAIKRLKEASATGATGFGAMNEAELQLLIDDVGALDPDTTDPEIFAKTVDRIERRFKRVVEDVKRNVSPERIRELGLQPLINQNSGGGEWQDAGGGVRIRRLE